jgi:uncharacterized protein (DUF58 family)
MIKGKSRYLDIAALAALSRKRFTTRRRIEGSYSGRHISRVQGGAGEFVDYREYSGGEDLRRLDWKVFARTGKAFVRLFQDETNLLCTVAVDSSASMRFGENSSLSTSTGAKSKLEYAQWISTALSHIISHGQDQVGLAVLGSELRDWLAPGGTPKHVARVQEMLESLTTTQTTHMANSLRELFERSPRRGVLLLLSDLLMEDLQEAFSVLRLFRHRGWEVIILHLVHPDEERLPPGVAFRLQGLEGEGEVLCSPAEIASQYEARFAAFLATARQLSLAAGCDYRLVNTAIPYLHTLGEFLIERDG